MPRLRLRDLAPARTARRLLAGERGAVVVEFALVAPLLFLLVFAIIDFGRAYYTLNQLVTASREGARYASMAITVPADADAWLDEVRAVVVGAAPAMGTPIPAGNVQMSVDAAAGTVTVTVRNYPFAFVTPLANTITHGPLQLTRSATFRLERAQPGVAGS